MGPTVPDRRPHGVSPALGRLWAVGRRIGALVQAVHGLPGPRVAARHEVRADPEREPRIAVAEVVTQRLDVLAGVQQDGGEEGDCCMIGSQSDLPQSRKALQWLVFAQRQVRNAPEGYWVAASRPEAEQPLATEYGMATWSGVFTMLQTGGPQELIEAVRKVEATGPTGVRRPRCKSGNDVTVAYCQW